mmetsp:Transcript_22842/g.51253  ORF Transcript_22842/g.51253 Transcript_22842/m.51253 type:complete len:433 (-) Transcript_22842:131-1429(-)
MRSAHLRLATRLRLNPTRAGADGHSSMHTVVMVRHGESVWNRENRFTGWCDVPLTAHGEADAIDAGTLMGERGLKFDVAFTSNLERAWRTCALTLAAAGRSNTETIRSSMLNERHYGALQGHKKDCSKLAAAFGDDTVMEWRRSYSVAPPSLYSVEFLKKMGPAGLLQAASEMDPRYIDINRLNDTLHRAFPDAPSLSTSIFTANALHRDTLAPSMESLAQCEHRAFGYWQEVIAPRVRAGERVLIVAHANTIRALVKAVDHIDDQKIEDLNIPNGVPLVYTMDENLDPTRESISDDLGFQANYLVSRRSFAKMMRFHRSPQKKLQSLFEYLDADGDGRITSRCLIHGFSQLRASPPTVDRHHIIGDAPAPAGAFNWAGSTQHNLEIREALIVQQIIGQFAAVLDSGGLTLRSFLDSEAQLIPQLNELKIMQ